MSMSNDERYQGQHFGATPHPPPPSRGHPGSWRRPVTFQPQRGCGSFQSCQPRWVEWGLCICVLGLVPAAGGPNPRLEARIPSGFGTRTCNAQHATFEFQPPPPTAHRRPPTADRPPPTANRPLQKQDFQVAEAEHRTSNTERPTSKWIGASFSYKQRSLAVVGAANRQPPTAHRPPPTAHGFLGSPLVHLAPAHGPGTDTFNVQRSTLNAQLSPKQDFQVAETEHRTSNTERPTSKWIGASFWYKLRSLAVVGAANPQLPTAD